MVTEPLLLFITAGAALLALLVASAALLRGWQEWLELRRLEVAQRGRGPAGARDLANLRKRVRRLEAIASGVDF
jgi:hypothetical protein